MMGRTHRLATIAWTVVAAGAALGFVARDLLQLPAPAVALCWVVGATVGALAARRRRV